MSTITSFSPIIDILYSVTLYGLFSFVGFKFISQIPAWWAQSAPQHKVSADTLPAPTPQTEVTAVVTPKVIAEVEVNEEPQAEIETPAQSQLDVLALKIYKLHNFQVVKVEAVEAQGVLIPDSIKRYAYRKIPQAVVRLKDLESVGLLSQI